MTAVFLRDIDERNAPPEQSQLRIAIVGEAVYLEVVKEVAEIPATYERIAGVCVPYGALAHALRTVVEDQAAHDRWRLATTPPKDEPVPRGRES